MLKLKILEIFLPGHGGLLDRIDGMIFVFPFYFFNIIIYFKNEKKNIAILGSTGSIGKQTLEIIKKI